MLLAELMVFWIAGVLLIVGFVAFFACVIAALGRVLRAIGRALLPAGPEKLAGSRRHSGPLRTCDRPHCGFLNRGDARYCARCGTALGPPTDVDRYG